MKRFLIIGGGAAGMLASVYAARNGMEVHLFEQNEKLGKKLFITGKGRCNFTNGCATEELFESFITNPRFLYSAVYGYTNYDVIDFFETAGVKTKMERGGRMFPMSDHSSDIIRALEQQMKKAGVKIHLGSRVKRLLVEKEEDGNARITGIQLDNGEKIRGEQVLVATGGNSYPSTGSTGVPCCSPVHTMLLSVLLSVWAFVLLSYSFYFLCYHTFPNLYTPPACASFQNTLQVLHYQL